VLGADLGPQVSVSAVAVEEIIAAAGALTQQTVEDDLTGAADRAERVLDGEYVPPETDLEATLCRRFADVLGLDRVGRHDDFFEAGGNSLVAIQLIAGIREETGVRVPMRTLFEAARVARLAVEIAAPGAGDGAEQPPAPPVALPRARSAR
jgi:acyl carrier protein